MSDYDELRAHVATEHARHGSGLMEMILARLDADAATIAKLTAERDAETARADRHASTIDWNNAQYERWKADRIRREADTAERFERASAEALRIARAVHAANRQGRKTVRIADLIGPAS